MATKEQVQTDRIIAPGDILLEEIESRGIKQKELAAAMGRPAQMVNEIIKGKKLLTAETALDLEEALGIAAHIWLGLEAKYREALARKARAKSTRQISY